MKKILFYLFLVGTSYAEPCQIKPINEHQFSVNGMNVHVRLESGILTQISGYRLPDGSVQKAYLAKNEICFSMHQCIPVDHSNINAIYEAFLQYYYCD